MKKVFSLLLAVVLVFSMATVALAADPVKVCEKCGFTTDVAADFNAHMLAKACGKCAYCANGFANEGELGAHEYVCIKANVGCDYCGGTFESHADFDAHIDACKQKYFNIPLAKIIATVKDIVSKIDFSKIIGTVKDVTGKVVPAVTNLIGGIGK